MAFSTGGFNKENEKGSTILVPVDFSDSFKAALRKANSLHTGESIRIEALHLIDHHLVGHVSTNIWTLNRKSIRNYSTTYFQLGRLYLYPVIN
jgi:hypothetical protein